MVGCLGHRQETKIFIDMTADWLARTQLKPPTHAEVLLENTQRFHPSNCFPYPSSGAIDAPLAGRYECDPAATPSSITKGTFDINLYGERNRLSEMSPARYRPKPSYLPTAADGCSRPWIWCSAYPKARLSGFIQSRMENDV